MCKGLIGKKIKMLNLFSGEGERIPVTVIQTGPCVVTQIKTEKIDGYDCLQLGFEKKKENRTNKPLAGHFKKSGQGNFKVLKEFAVKEPNKYSLGQFINSDMFEIGEKVNITGTIKGRGFAGVIKRHGFSGGRDSHGSNCHRIPGSIGSSAWPSKVVKGKKLPGHYGNVRQTVKNLEIVDIIPEENIIMVKGAVPGHRSSVLLIKKVVMSE